MWTKEKQAAYMKEYRKRHPEKFLAARRRYEEKCGADFVREYKRNWMANNRERTKAYREKFSAAHPDAGNGYRRKWLETKENARNKKREMFRRYYYRNREAMIAKAKRQQQENPESFREYAKASTHRRRAWKKRSGGRYTAAEWKWLLDVCKNRCLCCRRKEPEVKLEPDHVIPLCKQGRNDLENLQPLCGSCNRSKGSKSFDYRSDKIKKKISQYMLSLLQAE